MKSMSKQIKGEELFVGIDLPGFVNSTSHNSAITFLSCFQIHFFNRDFYDKRWSIAIDKFLDNKHCID